MATKEHKRYARDLIEALESRIHSGPPIGETELASAQEFLRKSSFSPASDYFNRLTRIQTSIAGRRTATAPIATKRNYGGEAGGRWMQVQSVYDHVILSTVYSGEFNLKRGRVKLSHRFNSAGRIDFVELKFLRSLSPWLSGGIRKLVFLKNYQTARKDWFEADAFTLRVLPQELIFLYSNVFRCPKADVLAWLINVGHKLSGDLVNELRNGNFQPAQEIDDAPQEQLHLSELREDEVAMPILQHASSLESSVEACDEQSIVVRYHRI